MREVVYAMFAGNPYIKTEHKPGKEDIIKLSIDEKVRKEKKKSLSPEEIEKIRLELINKIHGS